MTRKIFISARVFLFASICFILASCLFQKNEPTQVNNSPSIAALGIPEEDIEYPDDWPEDFRFPKFFTLVETSSGVTVGGTSQGWTAMYRFEDSVDEAETLLRNHLSGSGWQMPVIEKKENGSYVFLLVKGESNGFVVIEADPDGINHSLIMATFTQ